jgi:hypothetical protein
MNSTGHEWLGKIVDRDLLFLFPKGISVWLGAMRDPLDLVFVTMGERELQRYDMNDLPNLLKEEVRSLISQGRNLANWKHSCEQNQIQVRETEFRTDHVSHKLGIPDTRPTNSR